MTVLQGQKKVKYFMCWLHGDNYSLQASGHGVFVLHTFLICTPPPSTLKSMYTNLDSDRSAHFLLCYLLRHEILSVLQNYTLKQEYAAFVNVQVNCQFYYLNNYSYMYAENTKYLF